MTYKNAVAILDMQNKNIRKINNYRFEQDGYEYRIKFEGGFAAFVAIERREVGRRKFQYYSSISAANCWNVDEVMPLIQKEISKKGSVL
jgi:hypothetical protein